MVVLWEAEDEGEGAQALADVTELEPRHVPPLLPQMDGVRLDPFRDDLVGEPELAVELERTGVHDDGARRLTRPRMLLYDARLDAAAGENKREDQTRRAGPNDQHLGFVHCVSPILSDAGRLSGESPKPSRRAFQASLRDGSASRETL